MARGGARNRSGPQPDPKSGRSDRRGISLTALPAEGYDGPVPQWPLSTRLAYYVVEKARYVDDAETGRIAEREAEVWAWAWATPQACAWSQPSEAWRLMSIAMWVRTYVLCESAEATAADKNSLHRFADQIGLTPAGLKENGWAVKHDELGERRVEVETSTTKPKPQRRMRAVPGGNG